MNYLELSNEHNRIVRGLIRKHINSIVTDPVGSMLASVMGGNTFASKLNRNGTVRDDVDLHRLISDVESFDLLVNEMLPYGDSYATLTLYRGIIVDEPTGFAHPIPFSMTTNINIAFDFSAGIGCIYRAIVPLNYPMILMTVVNLTQSEIIVAPSILDRTDDNMSMYNGVPVYDVILTHRNTMYDDKTNMFVDEVNHTIEWAWHSVK